MFIHAPLGFSEEALNSFLSDPDLNFEFRENCKKFLKNPCMEKLFRRTPLCELFKIYVEYSKNVALYDEVFNGKIKYRLKGPINELLPVFNRNSNIEYINLERFFQNGAFVRQVVEIFSKCEESGTQVQKVAIKGFVDKMIFMGFNSDNQMVSTFVDFLEPQDQETHFAKFINSVPNKRIDLLRTKD